MHYDNFRLIDTGSVTTPVQPKIQTITLDAQKRIVITWTGAGTLQQSPSLSPAQWSDITGGASGTPLNPPAGGIMFYRVKGQ
jgi:hypothetical protein